MAAAAERARAEHDKADRLAQWRRESPIPAERNPGGAPIGGALHEWLIEVGWSFHAAGEEPATTWPTPDTAKVEASIQGLVKSGGGLVRRDHATLDALAAMGPRGVDGRDRWEELRALRRAAVKRRRSALRKRERWGEAMRREVQVWYALPGDTLPNASANDLYRAKLHADKERGEREPYADLSGLLSALDALIERARGIERTWRRQRGRRCRSRWSRESIAATLCAAREANGRYPTKREHDARRDLPGSYAVRQAYGSITAARLAADHVPVETLPAALVNSSRSLEADTSADLVRGSVSPTAHVQAENEGSEGDFGVISTPPPKRRPPPFYWLPENLRPIARARKAQGRDNRAAIVGAFESADRPLAAHEVAAAAGVNPETVRRDHLPAMLRSGEVERSWSRAGEASGYVYSWNGDREAA